MNEVECNTCKNMTEWYLKENPDKKGYVLCEKCYEKSKEFISYLKLFDQQLSETYYEVKKLLEKEDER